MAFGSSMNKNTQLTNGTEDAKSFEWQWIDTHSGNRQFRILPEIKDGKILAEPEAEVRWLEVWYDVTVNGQKARRRVILDWENPWSSPLWKIVSETSEKGSQERRAFKQKFGINVYDQTPVLFDAEGIVIYPNDKNVHNISAKGKVVSVATGTPLPLNRIRILEGSAGQTGGRHLLQQIADLMDSNVQDNTGKSLGLQDFDIRLRTTGEGINTNRMVRDMPNYTPLAKEIVLAPRYDIASWAKPWPTEMLKRILADEDFNELVEEYNISLFPQLAEDNNKPVSENLVIVDVDTDELFGDEPVKVTKKGSKFN